MGHGKKVRINSKCSTWRPVLSGVPLDSVLGHLIFILCVNEIPRVVECPVLQYADNVKTWREITGDADVYALLEDLDIVISWSKDWLVPINAAKFVYMHFGDTKVNRYNIRQVLVPLVRSHKVLG